MSNLILGLDPGTRITGFGIISVTEGTLRHVDHGVIPLKESWPLAQRLKVLSEQLEPIFQKYVIRRTVVERIFFGKNVDSAFKLGHARGVCMLAASRNGSEVYEYAARFVKKCVTGSGASTKDHVQLVIGNLLGLRSGFAALDASDALALAITHARESENQARIQSAMERSL
jgi:crossover junction endodeoxyribonuclease RuvC